MADTIPNIIVDPETIVDIYADPGVQAAGISIGDRIIVEMIADGTAKLYAGASLPTEPDNATGYSLLYGRNEKVNDAGDLGAFIWSREGCTINVSKF